MTWNSAAATWREPPVIAVPNGSYFAMSSTKKATSSVVYGLPSENLAPLRSVMVQVRLSFDATMS